MTDVAGRRISLSHTFALSGQAGRGPTTSLPGGRPRVRAQDGPADQMLAFSALRAKRASSRHFTIVVPLRFAIDRLIVRPAEALRADGHDADRVAELAAQIVANPDSWVLPSLNVSYDTPAEFRESPLGDSGAGTLLLPGDTHLVIEDGRLRQAALRQALEEDPRLAWQTIGLDLHPLHPGAAPDGGDGGQDGESVALAQAVARSVPVFAGLAARGRRPAHFATLRGLGAATGDLLDALGEPTDDDDAITLAGEFWRAVSAGITPWQQFVDGTVSAAEMKAEYVCGHAVVLRALATAGGAAVAGLPRDAWPEALAGLSEVDWRRASPAWQESCMSGPQITGTRRGRQATVRLLAGYLAAPGGAETEPDGPVAGEGARLIALNLALAGGTRAEAEAFLSEQYGLHDLDRTLDEVFEEPGP